MASTIKITLTEQRRRKNARRKEEGNNNIIARSCVFLLKKKERGDEKLSLFLTLSLSLSRARLMRACVTPLSLALLTRQIRYRIFIFRVSVKKEQKKTLESQTAQLLQKDDVFSLSQRLLRRRRREKEREREQKNAVPKTKRPVRGQPHAGRCFKLCVCRFGKESLCIFFFFFFFGKRRRGTVGGRGAVEDEWRYHHHHY